MKTKREKLKTKESTKREPWKSVRYFNKKRGIEKTLNRKQRERE